MARDSATVFGSMRVSCGPAARIDDALELLDLLRRAVLEDLEVLLREIGDGRAVLGRDRRRRGRSSLRCGRSAVAASGLLSLAEAGLRSSEDCTRQPAPAGRGTKSRRREPTPVMIRPKPLASASSQRWRASVYTGPSASSAAIRSRVVLDQRVASFRPSPPFRSARRRGG